jgi:hypothetical protein
LNEPVEADNNVDLNDRQAGNLQRKRSRDLLRKYDPNTQSRANDTAHLAVEWVSTDDFGSLELILSGDFRLQAIIAPHETIGACAWQRRGSSGDR